MNGDRRVRYTQGKQTDGTFNVLHTKSTDMPADFLGKWQQVKQYRRSRAHAMNLASQVPP